jgi:uncharacterized protein YbdZ (MbtH family)
MAQYKVVPGPVGIQGSKIFGAVMKETQIDRAAETFSSIISRESAAGWRLVCIDSTSVSTACFWFLSKEVTDMKLLVFTKE